MERSNPLNQYWLVNTRSGNGRGAILLHALKEIPGVSAVAIDFPNLAAQINSKPTDSMIVVAGGDGTFSAVLGHPEITSSRVACIPLGTANDLARELGVSRLARRRDWHELPSMLESLPVSPFAVWTVTVDGKEYPCANYVSIGYEGAVVHDFCQWRARTSLSGRVINRIAYSLFGLKRALYTIRGASLLCDEPPPIRCAPTTGLIITNIKSHLGLGISNSHSAPSDQVIECVSVTSVFGFLRMMAASVGLARPPGILARGKSILITGIPKGTPMQIDGEAHASMQSGELRVSFRHFNKLCHAP